MINQTLICPRTLNLCRKNAEIIPRPTPSLPPSGTHHCTPTPSGTHIAFVFPSQLCSSQLPNPNPQQREVGEQDRPRLELFDVGSPILTGHRSAPRIPLPACPAIEMTRARPDLVWEKKPKRSLPFFTPVPATGSLPQPEPAPISAEDTPATPPGLGRPSKATARSRALGALI